MMEEWKNIPDYGGYYQASSHGRIRSIERKVNGFSARGKRPVEIRRKQKILSQHARAKYLAVCLCVDGKQTTVPVHILVLSAFEGQRPEGMFCCHNNGDAFDNRPENLRWDYPKNNTADREAHGTALHGEAVKTAKFKEHEIKEMRYELGFKDAKEKFGVSKSQFYRIKRGESWGHISEHGVEWKERVAV